MGAAGATIALPVAEPGEDLVSVTRLTDVSVLAGGVSGLAEITGLAEFAGPVERESLPVLPALCDLLPGGGLRRGSVVAAGKWSLLCLALAAGPTADGAWCAVAGIPELGVRAAADAGLDVRRLLLVPDPGPNWAQVVASLLDGCDLVVLRPPGQPTAQLRRKLEAAVRRHGAVLLIAGDWDGAQATLDVVSQEWSGVGDGHGRLRARQVQVAATGRGGWTRGRQRWLWLPGPDGSVAAVAEAGTIAAGLPDLAADEDDLAGTG